MPRSSPLGSRLWAALLTLSSTACEAERQQGTASDTAPPAAMQPTWSSDVRDIVASNCVGCHVEDGSAPFPMQTAEQVAAISDLALAAMERGSMPPWMPDPDCQNFENERILAERDRETFAAWVAAGSPAGAPTEPLAPTVVSLEADQSALPLEPYTPSYADAPDDYHCFVLDLDVPETVYLSGTQVVPGSAAVHHVLVYALVGEQIVEMEEADAREPGPGYTCFGGPLPSQGNVSSLSGFTSGFPNQIAAWVPGMEPVVLADDLGIRVDAGSKLVMQVHYSAAADEPTPDQTRLDLALHAEPPARLATTRPFAITNLDIPAGDPAAAFSSTITNWSDQPVVLRALTAHMHLLGASQTLEVVRADGVRECALDIPDWDFSWQQSYALPPDAPLTLAPGDGLSLTCVYDNSAENQPLVAGVQQEPRDVAWGDGSLDEMCLAYLSVVEDFTPPDDASAPACDGSTDCWADCEDDDFACLLTCDTLAFECISCSITAGLECGLASCGASLFAAQDCLTECIMGGLSLGSSIGACLEATCPELPEAFGACAQPILDTGACEVPLAACGLDG